MKQVRSYCSSLLVAARSLAIVSAIALLIFSNATPAFAFGGGNSKQSEGLEQLGDVQSKSEQAITDGAKSAENSTRKVVKNSQEGLNGVQGRANKGNMISPSDAEGNTIEGNIEEALGEMK